MLSDKPWTPLSAFHLICWLWVSMSVGALAAHLVAPSPAEQDAHWRLVAMAVNVCCFHGAALIAISALIRERRANWSQAFGFDAPNRRRALILALVVAAVFLPVGLLVAKASEQLLTRLQGTAETQQVVQVLQTTSPGWDRFALGVVAIVIAPVVEELLFRGVFYPAVKQAGYPRLALHGSALLFALSHANAMTFVSLFLLALALTWLYEETNNILAPMLAHALFNAVNFFMITAL